MSERKGIGETVKLVSGGKVEIVDFRGEGGQGAVYEVKSGSSLFALKWYHKSFINAISRPDAFYDNLGKLISKGPPTSAFLWPIELTLKSDGSFGYIMDLRPEEFKEFGQFILTDVRFSNITAMANAALRVIEAFRVLHNNGYSYQDLNDGNFFINPSDGDVLICDNDNVAEYGENFGVLGKFGWMAPEVVLRKKMPDKHSDRYSLAVVLYRMLCFDHPMEGANFTKVPALTAELEAKLYGSDALFVFDPKDTSNRPVNGVHYNSLRFWPLYPKEIQDLFIKAFSIEALRGADTEQRVLEKKWFDAFIKLRDQIAACAHCGNETFVDFDKASMKCINCGQEIQRPLVLTVNSYNIALTPGKTVFALHVTGQDGDYQQEFGKVIASKKTPGLFGIQNRSKNIWNGVLPESGDRKPFKPGEIVPLGKGIKIEFGTVTGTIV